MIVTRDHLAVRPSAILTDVQEVTQASPQTPEALRLLDAELLEDLEGVDPRFDAWLQAERRQLCSRAPRIAESRLRDVNYPDEAIEAAERVLTIDRAHEGAWGALMNVHDAPTASAEFGQCNAIRKDAQAIRRNPGSLAHPGAAATNSTGRRHCFAASAPPS
jgi:DNA-binding SARP family transcriptional activator